MNQGIIEGHVSAGCLLFISGACTASQKQDALDSMLYTQLAATKKHSRFTASGSWRETCLAALNRFGWTLKGHESMSCPVSDLGPGSVWDWLSKQSPLFMPVDLVAQSKERARQSVMACPDQAAITLFARQVLEPFATGNEQKLVVQFGFLGPGCVMSLVMVTFTYRQSLTAGFVFESLDPQAVVGNVELDFYSMQLMDRVYAPYRENIGHALEDRRAGLTCLLMEVDHDQQ